ncbi:MAG TPA: prepilin peptidase [Rhizomicrobium sp.]|jgi:prepilin peptidase CpaA
MIAQFLLLMLATLLVAAAMWDIASFTIPNNLTIAIAMAFIPFAFTVGLSPGALGQHFLAGLIALIIGFTMFARNFIGGGDAKLYAGAALWLGLDDMLVYTLVATMLGGLLTLMVLGLRRFPLPAGLFGQAWLLKLHDARSGIPYGVALAGGVFAVLPHAQIFRLAALG